MLTKVSPGRLACAALVASLSVLLAACSSPKPKGAPVLTPSPSASPSPASPAPSPTAAGTGGAPSGGSPSTAPTGRGPSTPAPAPGHYTTTTKTISGTGTGSSYRVTYPLLAGGPQSASIDAAMDKAVDLNVHQILASFAGTNPSYRVTVTANVTKFTYLGPRQVSSWIDIEADPEGAAHPTAQVVTLVYDLDDATPVTLSRVFTSEQAGLNALSAYVRPKLLAQFGSAMIGTFTDGSAPTEKNFANWQATPAGMTITFQEYQVGPYAIGQPQVTVPWSQLPLSSYAQAVLTQ